MYSRGRRDNILDAWVLHLTDSIAEWTGGVDDSLGLDRELVGGLAVLLADEVLDLGSTKAAISVLLKTCNFEVVDDGGAVEGRSHGEGDVHAGVVVCAVVVNKSSDEIVASQHRESFNSLRPSQEVGGLNTLRSGQEIISLRSSPVIWCLPPLIQRQHDWKPRAQMRCGIQEVLTLSKGLLDERVLIVIQLPKCLLKVSDTAVNKLGRLGRCTSGEIITLNNRDLQSTSSSIKRDTGAGSSSTDDKEIILILILRLSLRSLSVLLQSARKHCLLRALGGRKLLSCAARTLQILDLLISGLDLWELWWVETVLA